MNHSTIKSLSKLMFILFLTFSITSCRPFSKESYLEQYGEFITEVSTNSANYTDNDWQKVDEKFKKFDEDWYAHFKEKLTWQEKLTTTKYQVEYTYYKNKPGAMDLFNIYIKGNLDKLKEQIKYYKENKMDGDIQTLLKQAKEIGDSSVIKIQGIIDEVEKSISK